MLPLRSTLLLLLSLYAGLVHSDWTGVSIEVTNFDSDWEFDSGNREARVTTLSFQLEEKFQTGLIAGGGFGYFDMRVSSDENVDSQNFDGGYLEIYLRRIFPLSEDIAFKGMMNFRYYSGNENSSDDSADIDWTEASMRLGLGMRFEHFRMTPFVAFYHIDGDIDDDFDSGSFENDDLTSQGVSFDFYVDPAAYIRVEVRTGYQEGGYLSFVRRY